MIIITPGIEEDILALVNDYEESCWTNLDDYYGETFLTEEEYANNVKKFLADYSSASLEVFEKDFPRKKNGKYPKGRVVEIAACSNSWTDEECYGNRYSRVVMRSKDENTLVVGFEGGIRKW